MHTPTAVRSIFIFACVACFTSNAFALKPETSSLVSTATIAAPGAQKLDGTTAYYGIKECKLAYTNSGEIQVTYTTTVDPSEVSGAQTRLAGVYTFAVVRDAATGVTCPGESCTTIDDGDYTLTKTTVLAGVPFRTLIGTASAACEDFDSEFFIRMTMRKENAEDTTIVPADARVIVDTKRPGPPTSFTFDVTENKISANWELPADKDVTQYGIVYSTTPFTGGVLSTTQTKSLIAGEDRTSSDFTVNLNAGDTVYVAMVTVDATGNESLLTEVQTALIVETNDFWELYQAAGGEETGGCNAVGGGGAAWLLLGIAGLFARRRKSLGIRKASAVVVLLTGLGFSSTASAESPISGSLELKLGGYYPGVDDEFGGNGPYAAAFGTDWRFYGEMEIGFFFWQGFGKLGTAYHLGYSSATGSALNPDGTSSSDETSFSIIANRASLLYRFDVLQEKFNVPLVPVLKVGPDYVLWYSDGGDGETSKVAGKSASGGKWGYHASLSLQFLLDVIDSSSAATFDMNWGVNNSYFFGEYMITQVDNFGGAGIDLSDNIWMFGLAFEY